MNHELSPAPAPERRSDRRIGPLAWWNAYGRRALFTLTLVAMAAPTAVWLQGRHEERMLAMAQRHEAKLVRAEGRSLERHERQLRFLDAALDPRANRSQREAALRYLSTKLGARSRTREWATEELERSRASCGQ